MSRTRCWCFTLNNYTSQDEYAVELLMKKANYGICGKEKGDLMQTPHLQGYIHLTNPVTLVAIKKFLPKAHLEVAKGNDNDNKIYCSKQNDYKEWGTPSVGQGSRTDIKDLAKLIQSREISLKDLAFEYPELYCKYSKSIMNLYTLAMPRRDRVTPPTIYWRWGLTGVGKTCYVWDTHPDIFVKDGSKWWDGYRQQEVILFDDFTAPTNPNDYRELLTIWDRNPKQVQIKGSYIELNSPIMYITCEYPPEHFWSGNELAQVLRRITSVQEIK